MAPCRDKCIFTLTEKLLHLTDWDTVTFEYNVTAYCSKLLISPTEKMKIVVRNKSYLKLFYKSIRACRILAYLQNVTLQESHFCDTDLIATISLLNVPMRLNGIYIQIYFPFRISKYSWSVRVWNLQRFDIPFDSCNVPNSISSSVTGLTHWTLG